MRTWEIMSDQEPNFITRTVKADTEREAMAKARLTKTHYISQVNARPGLPTRIYVNRNDD